MTGLVSAVSSQTLSLPAPPSCIVSTSIGFIIGTYTLDTRAGKGDQDTASVIVTDTGTSENASRSGSLVLIQAKDGDKCQGAPKFYVKDSFPTESAVLDVIIRESDGHSGIIAVANSTGCIELWTHERTKDVTLSQNALTRLKIVRVSDANILVLKISGHPSPSRKSVYAASLSDGSVTVVDVDATDRPVLWQASVHSLEAWEIIWFPSTSSHCDNSSTLLSGGDDSALHVVQVPEQAPSVDGDLSSGIVPSSDARTHGAGVTSIVPISDLLGKSTDKSGTEQELILTGSYDDRLRLLRPRRGRRWECLAEVDLGGGVWRILPLPWVKEKQPQEKTNETSATKCLYLLASCMYAGARIVRLQQPNPDEQWSFEIVAQFTEHESMNYASTVFINGIGKYSETLQNVTFITTSFYDRRFCVWSYPSESE